MTVLLTTATTSTHAGPPPPSGPVRGKTYEFVDADSVPSGQLEHLNNPQSFADYVRSRSEPGATKAEWSATTADEDADRRIG